jgi:hypothetical protein
MRKAIAAERHVTVIVNNRAGGNAPLIAERLAERFRAGKTGAGTAGLSAAHEPPSDERH